MGAKRAISNGKKANKYPYFKLLFFMNIHKISAYSIKNNGLLVPNSIISAKPTAITKVVTKYKNNGGRFLIKNKHIRNAEKYSVYNKNNGPEPTLASFCSLPTKAMEKEDPPSINN